MDWAKEGSLPVWANKNPTASVVKYQTTWNFYKPHPFLSKEGVRKYGPPRIFAPLNIKHSLHFLLDIYFANFGFTHGGDAPSDMELDLDLFWNFNHLTLEIRRRFHSTGTSVLRQWYDFTPVYSREFLAPAFYQRPPRAQDIFLVFHYESGLF